MGKGVGRHQWLVHLAIVIGYIATYSAIRPISGAHWALTGSLRLACLLVLPYRYWPALAIGDAIPLSFIAIRCYPQFGAVWSALTVLPPIVLAMPIVRASREGFALFPTRHTINFKTLLICTLSVSITWAVVNFVMVALSNQQADHAEPVQPIMVLGLFLGKYIAILTVVPWVLIAKIEYKAGTLRAQLVSFAKSRLAVDAFALLVPGFLILTWFSTHNDSQSTREMLRMLMFWPVAWLTLKHGWRAAVLGSTVAIACVALQLEGLADTPDPEVIQAQAFMAFTVTCLFVLGARITTMIQREERERIDDKRALSLARKSIQASEMRLKRASESLEVIAGTLQLTQNRLLDRFRYMLPIAEGQSFYRAIAFTQNQIYGIADSIHPMAWRGRGLPAALQDTIGRALDERGIHYHCDIKGRSFTDLSPGVRTALYRFACEGIVQILSQQWCSQIRLALRVGENSSERWAVLRVEGVRIQDGNSTSIVSSDESKRLAAKLGANGMATEALRDHVGIYDGRLHTKTRQDRLFITAGLRDTTPEARSLPKVSAPGQLWVR